MGGGGGEEYSVVFQLEIFREVWCMLYSLALYQCGHFFKSADERMGLGLGGGGGQEVVERDRAADRKGRRERDKRRQTDKKAGRQTF